MATRLKPVDAVTVGVGWTGGIVAAELTKAGYHVVGLERGEYRNTDPDFEIPQIHDELAYAVRLRMMQDAAKYTYTFRNSIGQTGRFLPWDFELRSRTVGKYGAKRMNGLASRDWGITYEELEPYYDRFEYQAGISGK